MSTWRGLSKDMLRSTGMRSSNSAFQVMLVSCFIAIFLCAVKMQLFKQVRLKGCVISRFFSAVKMQLFKQVRLKGCVISRFFSAVKMQYLKFLCEF